MKIDKQTDSMPASVLSVCLVKSVGTGKTFGLQRGQRLVFQRRLDQTVDLLLYPSENGKRRAFSVYLGEPEA